MSLLDQLRELRSRGPSAHHMGICVNSGDFYRCRELLTRMGLDCDYPVEGTLALYSQGRDRGTLWSRKSPYGRERWALLDQMIAFLEKREC